VQLHGSHWKLQAKQLLALLGSPEKDDRKVKEILSSLNAFVYPVESNCEVETFVNITLHHPLQFFAVIGCRTSSEMLCKAGRLSAAGYKNTSCTVDLQSSDIPQRGMCQY